METGEAKGLCSVQYIMFQQAANAAEAARFALAIQVAELHLHTHTPEGSCVLPAKN